MNHMTIHIETPRSKMQQMMGPDICVPVSSPICAVGRVKSWQRPALEVVRTLYRGSHEELGGAWHEFGKWTEANGYKTAGDLYECYMVGPESSPDSAKWRTEGDNRGHRRTSRAKRFGSLGGLADYLATG